MLYQLVKLLTVLALLAGPVGRSSRYVVTASPISDLIKFSDQDNADRRWIPAPLHRL
jgi:hypothetical protein